MVNHFFCAYYFSLYFFSKNITLFLVAQIDDSQSKIQLLNCVSSRRRFHNHAHKSSYTKRPQPTPGTHTLTHTPTFTLTLSHPTLTQTLHA